MKLLNLLLFTIPALLGLMAASAHAQEPRTVYQYFTDGGIQSGLEANTPGFFKLNGLDLRIISGALHYFRVHPSLWRDRLKKLRAAGLNTVETYIPWNLHEPQIGYFDFGSGTDQFSPFLDMRRFIAMAQEEDLLVLFRPGPYICSEWDFGGLPSWLLRDPDMKVRTSYEPFLQRVTAYFDQLLPQIVDLQFTNGGPIIGIQIENEYGSFAPIHKSYLEHIKGLYDRHGLTVLQFTSDGAYNGPIGALPESGVLMTANFQSDPKYNLDLLIQHQPGRPTMVMEYWSGWFDHWFEQHHEIPLQDFAAWLEGIFNHSQTSVNFYMFHGGTNLGFMAGANRIDAAPGYAPDVTSYDYNAPLSESGDYTDKYYKAMELIRQYEEPKLLHPPLPAESLKTAYGPISVDLFWSFQDWTALLPPSAIFSSDKLQSMESLDMNNGSGQSYGYIMYETTLEFTELTATLNIDTPVRDFGLILLDEEIVGNVSDYWINTVKTIELNVATLGPHRLTLFVENMGRVNFGVAADFIQHKGLTGTLQFNSQPVEDFRIYAAEFKQEWIQGLTKGTRATVILNPLEVKAPGIFQASLTVTGTPADTFVDMRNWHKGILFINGFNLGRYFKVGPQQTLYLPAPFLNEGENTITVFEELEPGTEIRFSSSPILG